MYKTKKYFLGLYSKKINIETGLVKDKILGITIKKSYNNKYKVSSDLKEANIDETMTILQNFYKEITKLCKENQYNLLLHRHLGDSYVLLCFRHLFEEKYKKNLHFLVKPRQEVLMKLFDIQNYTVYDSTELLNIKDYAKTYNYTETQAIDKLEENVFEHLFCSIPILDKPFICAPINYIKEKHNYVNFVHGWGTMLGLQVEKITPPKINLELSPVIRNALKDIDISKVVCFAPEANSCNYINKNFWELLALELKKQGYYIVTNVVNKNNIIKGTNFIDCSLFDFITLVQNCKAIFTIRSGLADIVCAIQKNCFVFSTEEIYQDYFYMNKIYKLPHEIDEITLKAEIKMADSVKVIKNIINKIGA